MLARQFHEPIHSQVLEHGSFDLLLLIDGKHVVRHDLRRGRPTLELVKSKRAEELAAIVFPEKPPLPGGCVNYSLGGAGVGEAVGAGAVAPAGIMMV